MRIGLSHALQRGSLRFGCFFVLLCLPILLLAAMSTSHGPGERGQMTVRRVCDKTKGGGQWRSDSGIQGHMKEIAINEYGLENVTLMDLPEPEAGRGEVVVRLRAAALNRLDLWTLIVSYTHLTLPTIYSV